MGARSLKIYTSLCTRDLDVKIKVSINATCRPLFTLFVASLLKTYIPFSKMLRMNANSFLSIFLHSTNFIYGNVKINICK